MFTLPTIDTVGTGIRIMDLRKKAIWIDGNMYRQADGKKAVLKT